MAAARGTILLLLLLLPSASAQVPALPASPPPTIEVLLDAFADEAIPGGLAQTTTATVRVSCALVATSPQTGLPVTFEATGPAWASVFANPPGALIDPKACAGATFDVPVTLAARGGFAGAAGDVGDVQLSASAPSPAGAQTGSAKTPLTLGYNGAVGLTSNATRATIRSLTEGSVQLTVKNNGNARSVIAFDVKGTSAMKVEPVEAVTLDPGQSVEKTLRFRSLAEVGLAGQTDPVSVNATSAREETGEAGAWKRLEVIVVTTAAPQLSEEKDSPGPAGALLALGVACAARATRRRRS